MNYETVIGLEVHSELNTNSKLFCSCSTDFGSPPNTNICPVCTGQPGVLPVLNKKAVEFTVLTGLALNCEIAKSSLFDRKNYFYPDLPKNYQISQFEKPLAENGYIILQNSKKIRIRRVHLEEDAGKLLHSIGDRELNYSLVDYNRTGIPLMEIVTLPDINSPDEAEEYLLELKKILEYIGVSTCDMEKGKLRCDANISMRPEGEQELGVKVELKNMNSFKNIHKALTYEIKRQTGVLNSGGKIIQETRLWNDLNNETVEMRKKEGENDYRYFPEPDLVPVEISEEMLEEIRKMLIELPKNRKKRFTENYGLSEYDAGVLTGEKKIADYYESVLKCFAGLKEEELKKSAKTVSNWVTGELLGILNEKKLEFSENKIKPEALASIIKKIFSGEISGKIAKTIFAEVFISGKPPEDIIKEKNLVQISDTSALEELIAEVVKENPGPAGEYKNGNDRAIGFLIGKVMSKSKGQANPRSVNTLIRKKLRE